MILGMGSEEADEPANPRGHLDTPGYANFIAPVLRAAVAVMAPSHIVWVHTDTHAT